MAEWRWWLVWKLSDARRMVLRRAEAAQQAKSEASTAFDCEHPSGLGCRPTAEPQDEPPGECMWRPKP